MIHDSCSLVAIFIGGNKKDWCCEQKEECLQHLMHLRKVIYIENIKQKGTQN